MDPFYGPSATWMNGSLYSQINNSSALASENPYPSPDVDPGVNLTILPSHALSLSFPVGNGNVSLAMPVLLMLMNPNATLVDIPCSYPLSGQYDRLQRSLFYGTLIVALLFRRNGMIAIAALGVAMTYSALAAVHLFVLLTWYGWGTPSGEIAPYGWDSNSSQLYGDIDYFGILPVLTATAVMLTPILTWSSTIRTHKARAVMIYWALLIFAAMVPTIYLWVDNSWELNIPYSFAYCTGTGNQCSWSNLENYMDTDSYQNCNCIDFCGLLSPTAPLRHGANMVAYIGMSVSERVLNKGLNAIEKTYEFVYAIWVFTLIHGVLTLLSIRSSPIEVRNAIFRTLNADGAAMVGFFFKGDRRKRMLQRLHIKDATTTGNDTTYRKIRRYFAKLSATTYLAITVLGAIVYPAVFVTTIVLNELVIDGCPVSEYSDAVGAWSPFVGAGLVIIASLIVRVHSTLVGKLSYAFSRSLNYLRYGPEDRPKIQSTKSQGGKRGGNNFLASYTTPSDHIWYLIHRRGWIVRTQLKLFGEWWKDPENLSDPTRWADVIDADRQKVSDNPTWTEIRNYRWDMELGRPKCECRNCKRNATSGSEIHEESRMTQDNSGAGAPLLGGVLRGEARADEIEMTEITSFPS